MKKTLLISSIAMIVIGFIARVYADAQTYVDESGILHDSAWLPVGTLLIVLGILALIISGVMYLMSRKAAA